MKNRDVTLSLFSNKGQSLLCFPKNTGNDLLTPGKLLKVSKNNNLEKQSKQS